MSLFHRSRRESTGPGASASEMMPRRSSGRVGAVTVTNDTAMRHSAVWACLRLRADLISTMPVDVYRKVAVGGQKIQVEMPKPPVLVDPCGERVDWMEWSYSSQVDLDRAGNTVGLITERNAAGLPGRIDLQGIGDCSLRSRKGVTKWRIGQKDYDLDQVWHEKAYTVAGFPLGLSPVAYAAWSIGQYQSAQQFALDWYGNGGIAKAHFRNTVRTDMPQGVAEKAKERYRAAVDGNDLLVTGRDWELKPIQAEAVGSEWLEAQKYGVGDIARFFGCPGDLIDAAVSTGHITYASISQRNLQFLIMYLGPAIARRESRLSRLLPQPRFVKLNTSALLRMDDEARARVIETRIKSRTLAVSEARALENLPPLTEAQMTEFDRLFGDPRARQRQSTPTPQEVGGPHQ